MQHENTIGFNVEWKQFINRRCPRFPPRRVARVRDSRENEATLLAKRRQRSHLDIPCSILPRDDYVDRASLHRGGGGKLSVALRTRRANASGTSRGNRRLDRRRRRRVIRRIPSFPEPSARFGRICISGTRDWAVQR